MKWVAGLWGLALLAGCDEPAAPQTVAEIPKPPECRTVTVFSSTKIVKPDKKLPDGWKAFSGVWGKAGWDNNTWCHDLYVLKIEKDGKVILMDTHGPGGNNDATAFRRVGQLDPDNHLRFRADGIRREYWIENGMLRGVKYLSDSLKSEILMTRKSG
jgi:hypothetical protein